jgi:hypothetical protein
VLTKILSCFLFLEKSYKTAAEEAHRKSIFSKNLNLVKKHNSIGNSSYTLAMNDLGDLTAEEFNALLNGVIIPSNVVQ